MYNDNAKVMLFPQISNKIPTFSTKSLEIRSNHINFAPEI